MPEPWMRPRRGCCCPAGAVMEEHEDDLQEAIMGGKLDSDTMSAESYLCRKLGRICPARLEQEAAAAAADAAADDLADGGDDAKSEL